MQKTISHKMPKISLEILAKKSKVRQKPCQSQTSPKRKLIKAVIPKTVHSLYMVKHEEFRSEGKRTRFEQLKPQRSLTCRLLGETAVFNKRSPHSSIEVSFRGFLGDDRRRRAPPLICQTRP